VNALLSTLQFAEKVCSLGGWGFSPGVSGLERQWALAPEESFSYFFSAAYLMLVLKILCDNGRKAFFRG